MESETTRLEETVKALQEIRMEIVQTKQHKLSLLRLFCFTNAQRLSAEETSEIYKDLTGDKWEFKDISCVKFDFSKAEHQNVAKEFTKYRIPFVSSFQILNIPENDQTVKDLMMWTTPNRQEEFSFNYSDSDSASLDGEKYFYELKEVSIRITRTFRIWNTKFTQQAFWALVNSAKKWKEICFIRCTIPTKTIWDFGNMEGCQIEVIDLKYTGSEKCSNCGKFPKRLTNIFDGIFEWNHLLENLKQIITIGSSLFCEAKEKAFKPYDLSKFKLFSICKVENIYLNFKNNNLKVIKNTWLLTIMCLRFEISITK